MGIIEPRWHGPQEFEGVVMGSVVKQIGCKIGYECKNTACPAQCKNAILDTKEGRELLKDLCEEAERKAGWDSEA
jgi:hypothetical protein